MKGFEESPDMIAAIRRGIREMDTAGGLSELADDESWIDAGSDGPSLATIILNQVVASGVSLLFVWCSARIVERLFYPEDKASKKAVDTTIDELEEHGVDRAKLVGLSEHEKLIATDLIFPEQVETGFVDIGGLTAVKRSLIDTIILPFVSPTLTQQSPLLRPAPGVMLYGPPGTGKTMLAKALAKESGARFINISASSLLSKWVGETNHIVTALFSFAQRVQPCLIFIDEMDALFRSRSSGDSEVSRDMKAEFMALWDGLLLRGSIIVVGATNRPWDIDPAILRRMPRSYFIDLPNAADREVILRKTLSGMDVAPDVNYAELALQQRVQPCLIFIDEMDALFRSRSSGDSEVSRDMKAEFMALWDGLLLRGSIIVVGATNRPWDIDPAILRRMPRSYFIDLPNAADREVILRKTLSGMDVAPDVNYAELAAQTHGYSGADLSEVCRSAVQLVIMRSLSVSSSSSGLLVSHVPRRNGGVNSADEGELSTDARPTLDHLTHADLLTALRDAQPTRAQSMAYRDQVEGRRPRDPQPHQSRGNAVQQRGPFNPNGPNGPNEPNGGDIEVGALTDEQLAFLSALANLLPRDPFSDGYHESFAS
ncbi:ATPase family AAA domain-containing protein 1-A [Porphyridium purpureum]|uniref:ATPase family AAA domain-containing protein 1-A n=1 Tax=Porphyridium purpureum TaxID=35688 RepID=A0A5J4Z964_PORPP|nr:ATPase family AAA domain-containing protein 1-A [Porphyridium purpureum]|eukprot:POR9537..scf295_1